MMIFRFRSITMLLAGGAVKAPLEPRLDVFFFAGAFLAVVALALTWLLGITTVSE